MIASFILLSSKKRKYKMYTEFFKVLNYLLIERFGITANNKNN